MHDSPENAEAGLLRTSEVAERLRLSPDQVRRKANKGQIPGAYRLGGKGTSLRFDAAELERWLEAPEGAAPGGAA